MKGTKKISVVTISVLLLASLFFALQTSFLFPFVSYTRHSQSISRTHAQESFQTWLEYLRKNSPNHKIRTSRIGCRELQAGAQSCVYEGLVCIDTTGKPIDQDDDDDRPHAYFVDDNQGDGGEPPSDKWCSFRHQSSDPRYYSASRHWPILKKTFFPQHSCLRGKYRTAASLFGSDNANMPKRIRVQWLPSLSLVDLDFKAFNHNYHLLMDIIWLLDAALWQQSVDLRLRPGDLTSTSSSPHDFSLAYLFDSSPRHVYLPQSTANFSKQTDRDVNKLLYALILRLDLTRLYTARNISSRDIREPAETPREAAPLLEAYPNLIHDQRLLFHDDIVRSNQYDYVCTPRFRAGAKIGNGAHERVCRDMRKRSYELYGIAEPEVVRLGRALFPQPPKRIIIYQRHVTRPIANVDELEHALREAFGKYGVEVERYTTAEVLTAEDQVRMFARAGVVVTPHGSQSMGQIWMPRYR